MKISKKSAVILLGIFFIALPLLVFAANEQVSATNYVGSDQIIDGNYIKLGKVIDVSGAVNGDVIVAGNSVTISGPVAGDVIAAGNSVKITGPVSGSVRVVGNTVEIDNAVERNVWIGAAAAVINQNADIGWDVFAAAGSLEIKGKVGGNINASSATVNLGGEVGKNVDLSINSSGQVVLYPPANIAGSLTYHAARDSQLVLQAGAKVAGETKRVPLKIDSQFDWKRLYGAIFFFNIISFFSLLIAGLVILTLMPKILFNVNEEMTTRPLPSLALGLIYAVAIPVVAVLLMITIIGFPLAAIILPLYLIALYLAKIFAAFTVGLYLVNYFSRNRKFGGSLLWPLILGLLLMLVLTSLPFVGWLIKLLLVLWGFGAIITANKEILRDLR